MTTVETRTEDRREMAIKRLQNRRDFWTHVTAYAVVNGVIVVLWLVLSGGGLFWPMFPLLGWGIGLFFHGVDVYRRPLSEDRIRQEMTRVP